MTHAIPSIRRRMLVMAGAAATLPTLSLAADPYPSRPIDFIVPWGAGGGADQLARRLGKLLETELGVSLPILNVPGATGNTGTAKLMSSPPDGQSICVLIADTLGTLAAGTARWKLADLTPLGVMIRQPSGVFVKADAKWKTFDDLLADARQNELKAGVTGFGSAEEIQVVQMSQKGYKFRVVPFASPGERYSSILGGHADVLIEQAGDVRSFLDSKQMRPLAFFSEAPQVGYPDVPLAKSSGFPIAISQFRAIVVRSGTDAAQVAALSAAVEKAAGAEDFKTYLKEELAFDDSFIPASKSQAFLERELQTLQSNLVRKKS